ncbi:hypothetical protein TNCV_4942301 [Trichonephila clavipes]|nr:hypothetical protein TNCV_4942301 [Trichonephila clavipes]
MRRPFNQQRILSTISDDVRQMSGIFQRIQDSLRLRRLLCLLFAYFRISNPSCIEELLFYYCDNAASAQKNPGTPPTVDNPAIFTERHFVSHIPPIPAKRQPTRLCKNCCSKKDANGIKIRKETQFWCNNCGFDL